MSIDALVAILIAIAMIIAELPFIGSKVGLMMIAVIMSFGLTYQQEQTAVEYAPDFTVTTYDGETIRLSDLRGRPVVVNFWASWCPPCREEAPLLQSLWERYRDQGVVFLGITYVDYEPASRAFIEEFGITYPNAPDLDEVISTKLYMVAGIPETFVIAQNGSIVDSFWSLEDEAQLSTTLDRLLQAG